MLSLVNNVPEKVDKGNISLESVTVQSKWKTLARGGGGFRHGWLGTTFEFSDPVPNDDGTTKITATHTTGDQETRLIAIDRKGKVHPSVSRRDYGGGDLQKLEARFDVSVKDIKEFQLQARQRATEIVEFKNIAIQQPPKAQNPWKKTLKNGLTVELVGVSTYPSSANSWWTPDGQPLAEAPIDDGFAKNEVVKPDKRLRVFAFQLSDAPDYLKSGFGMSPQDGARFLWFSRVHRIYSDLSKSGVSAPSMRALLVMVPVGGTKGTVFGSFRTYDGPWSTILRGRGDSPTETGSKRALFGRPVQDDSGHTNITVSHNIMDTYRWYESNQPILQLAAVEQNGTIHPPISQSSRTHSALQQLEASFRLEASQIKEFQIRSRNLKSERGEFKDVALQTPARAEIPSESSRSPLLRGHVVYNDPDHKARIKMFEIKSREAEHCPDRVLGPGWYVDKDSKGVRYAVVYLSPKAGMNMPVDPVAMNVPQDSDGDIDWKSLRSTKCQFEPRVLCLHPKQDLGYMNDEKYKCELLLSSFRNKYSNVFEPGASRVFKLQPENEGPMKCSSQICPWKSAYVWKFTHPYATVTDENGYFEIRNLPELPQGENLELWVWHEMLPGNQTKKIGEFVPRKGRIIERRIGIPK